VYNPAQTEFLKGGKERGAMTCNGEQMLVIQAEESWRIWNAHVSDSQFP
jgi:shikimate dehydrogenase